MVFGAGDRRRCRNDWMGVRCLSQKQEIVMHAVVRGTPVPAGKIDRPLRAEEGVEALIRPVNGL
jgi:hypothetical protein